MLQEQVHAAASGAAGDPNALVKPVRPENTVLPAAEKPAEAPNQVNETADWHSANADSDRRQETEEAEG